MYPCFAGDNMITDLMNTTISCLHFQRTVLQLPKRNSGIQATRAIKLGNPIGLCLALHRQVFPGTSCQYLYSETLKPQYEELPLTHTLVSSSTHQPESSVLSFWLGNQPKCPKAIIKFILFLPSFLTSGKPRVSIQRAQLSLNHISCKLLDTCGMETWRRLRPSGGNPWSVSA